MKKPVVRYFRLGALVSLAMSLAVCIGCASETDSLNVPSSNPQPPSPAPAPSPSLVPTPGDSSPPTISLTIPAAGTVSRTVTVNANASDNVGVVGVQFRLNGSNFGSEDASTPYSVSWNTSVLTPGTTYTLSATARDAAGLTTTSAGVSVTVRAPPVPPNPGNSLTVGYNAATQTVTSSTAVLDMAQPAAGNYPAWISGPPYPGMERAATHDVLPGGFLGAGFRVSHPAMCSTIIVANTTAALVKYTGSTTWAIRAAWSSVSWYDSVPGSSAT